MRDNVTLDTLAAMKARGEKITALTAYDYPFARLVDESGAEIILVGDSLGMVFRGEDDTLKVTIEEMAYHVRAVRRGVTRAFLLADMPFLSFNVNEEETLRNAGRLVTAGAQGVKLEGAGEEALRGIARLREAGIPVMGHLGLTPQSVHQLGGYKVQGKKREAALQIIDQARKLEEAGAFAMVLECVPAELGAEITKLVDIPTIGIGAGIECDGQILVTHDLLGLSGPAQPKFVKSYADLNTNIEHALSLFRDETRRGIFPGQSNSYHMPTSKTRV